MKPCKRDWDILRYIKIQLQLRLFRSKLSVRRLYDFDVNEAIQ